MPSIKKNVLYSTVLTISGYLFPLITYPYVTRVLGVDKLGVCNFVDSIIQYGILFSMLGIGTVAIREIAQSKSDKEKLSKSFSSLLVLNLITSVIAVAVILVLAFTIPKFSVYQKLFVIGASRILFNSLLVEWLYKGLEEFRYITIRSLLIRVLYVIAVFVFVRSSSDYIVYFAINVGIVIINAIVNIIYSRNYLEISFRGIDICPYIKPFFILGLYSILTSMYTSFNVMYLGLVSSTTEVGYYTTAVKLYTLVISVFAAFTGVMMPRLSSLLSEGKIDEFLRLANKSVDLLFASIMPLVVIVISYANEIISIIAGHGYEGAVIPLRIIAPLLLIIGYEQVIVIQMLMPLQKDKAILVNSIVGAMVGLFLNILLVGKLNSVGSAIVWIVSELSVMISAQIFISKYITFSFPWKRLVGRLLVAIPIVVSCLMLKQITENDFLTLAIGLLVVGCYYLIIERFIYKNEYLLFIVHKVKQLHG